jgi:S-adenosylmethionine hydrolase
MPVMAFPRPIITLLTDFGEADAYVGIMKGVMLGILPEVQFVDISHQVTPQDVQQAALILSTAYSYFPAHTVHLVVVDPGVGGQRHPIVLDTPHGRFVAPDNGVLTYVRLLEPSSKPFVLDKPRFWRTSPSHTFHGRDIFSPVAAHLASGVSPREMGSPLEQINMLPLRPLEVTPTAIRGEVIRVDRFGNAMTNIMRLSWVSEHELELQPLSVVPGLEAPLRIDARQTRITCSWHTLDRIYRTYSEVAIGQALALVGSNGELEIAVNRGSASDALALKVGDPVTLHLLS